MKTENERALDARNMLLRLVANFPGLVDGETDVSGADVVAWLTNEIHAIDDDWFLKAYAAVGSPPDTQD